MAYHSDDIERLVKQLRGPRSEDAYHTLLEANDDVVSELEQQFRREDDGAIREVLVEIIWRRRAASAIKFLEEALADPCDEVWKGALDGLVACESCAARKALGTAIIAAKRQPDDRSGFLEYAEEAMEQLNNALGPRDV